MKLNKNHWLIIGILAGILTGGGWLAWGAISTQVGIHGLTTEVTPAAWVPIEVNNSSQDAQPTSQNGLLINSYPYVFNGSTWDRARIPSDGVGGGIYYTGISIFRDAVTSHMFWRGGVSTDQTLALASFNQVVTAVNANADVDMSTNDPDRRAIIRKIRVNCSAGTSTLQVFDGASIYWRSETNEITNLPQEFDFPTGLTDPTSVGNVVARLLTCGVGNTGTIIVQGDSMSMIQ